MTELSDYQVIDLIVKSTSAFFAIVTLAIGVYKYFHSVECNFRSPLWERQLQLYFEISEVVSTLATSSDTEEILSAEKLFWNLYFGPLLLVEDTGVESVVVEIALLLEIPISDRPQEKIKSLALKLGYECRNSISVRWRTSLPELAVKYKI
ncbi:hypothetical protein [Thaumasiovibrio sp. DFM-14]|uniref:hypothetical protein n=1 Tax=Thaumasiovibrio sp. DFM-14 TaxID=3384792 RepID=UPI0039A2CAAD